MVFDVFQYSNKGGRSYNEDASGWITDNDVGIFVVADGLGGHALGDLASDTAVTMLVENIWIDKAEDVSEQLSNKIGEANRAILKLQEQGLFTEIMPYGQMSVIRECILYITISCILIRTITPLLTKSIKQER